MVAIATKAAIDHRYYESQHTSTSSRRHHILVTFHQPSNMRLTTLALFAVMSTSDLVTAGPIDMIICQAGCMTAYVECFWLNDIPAGELAFLHDNGMADHGQRRLHSLIRLPTCRRVLPRSMWTAASSIMAACVLVPTSGGSSAHEFPVRCLVSRSFRSKAQASRLLLMMPVNQSSTCDS